MSATPGKSVSESFTETLRKAHPPHSYMGHTKRLMDMMGLHDELQSKMAAVPEDSVEHAYAGESHRRAGEFLNLAKSAHSRTDQREFSAAERGFYHAISEGHGHLRAHGNPPTHLFPRGNKE